jgi:hypothetical protein
VSLLRLLHGDQQRCEHGSEPGQQQPGEESRDFQRIADAERRRVENDRGHALTGNHGAHPRDLSRIVPIEVNREIHREGWVHR